MTTNTRLIAILLLLSLLGGGPAVTVTGREVLAQEAPIGSFVPDEARASPLPGPLAPDEISSGLPRGAGGPEAAGPASTTILEAGRDAFVSSAHPDTNYGSEGSLYVGERPGYGGVRSLVWFETQDLARDQAVLEAEVLLYLRRAEPAGDPERDIVARRVDESWGEYDVTWNDFPDYKDRRVDGTRVGTSTGWYGWDVTELVQRWRWPHWQDWHRDNYGVYLQGYETGGSYRQFDASEGSRDPQLRITHVTDRVAPVARLNPDTVPLYSTTPDPARPYAARIRLEWSGQDPPPATGIDYFRLEAQRNREPWVLVGDRLRTTSGWFAGENGKRFGFRVAAVDMAGNVEPTTPAEVQTLVDLSPPVTTVHELPPYERGPFLLSWSGYDEPIGQDLFASGIKSYNVYYRINGGGWGPLWVGLTETSRLFQPQQGFRYDFQVQATDMAGNFEPRGAPEAHTHVDGLPPVVRFDPITGISRRTFTVRWKGVDPGRSGVVDFDIQWRRDLEPWTDWVVATTQTQLEFSGQMSHVYSFRGRARDRAGNQGAYPQRPQLTVGVIDRAILTHLTYLPVVPQTLLP